MDNSVIFRCDFSDAIFFLNFIDEKISFKFIIRLSQKESLILSMKLSGFKISLSVESYDEKTAENYRNYYVAKQRMVSKLSIISISNFDSTN